MWYFFSTVSQQEIQLNHIHHSDFTEIVPSSSLNFEEFANQPEYVEVNRNLIERLFDHIPQRFFHVDIATGTGLVPKLLMQQSQERGYKAKIIGIDPNPTSLEIARRTTPQSDAVDVLYLEGFGQDTEKLVYGKISPYGTDSASMHDAIHEVEGEENKREVLSAAVRVLKPGGLFSFNSAFTTYGIEAENAQMKWGRWKLNAFNDLKGTKDRKAEPIRIYSPEQYKQMLEAAGLVIIHEAKKVVHLSKEALAAISKYPKFIEGVFGDMIGQQNFSLERKSSALIKTLEKVDFLPRGWYEIIAQKPPVTIL